MALEMQRFTLFPRRRPQGRALDELRLTRERHMDGLQIAKQQAFQEAEIAAREATASP